MSSPKKTFAESAFDERMVQYINGLMTLTELCEYIIVGRRQLALYRAQGCCIPTRVDNHPEWDKAIPQASDQEAVRRVKNLVADMILYRTDIKVSASALYGAPDLQTIMDALVKFVPAWRDLELKKDPRGAAAYMCSSTDAQLQGPKVAVEIVEEEIIMEHGLGSLDLD